MMLGWPYPKRKALIEDLTDRTSDRTFPVRFQGRLHHYPIHRVPIAMPKYRLSNGRTQAAQLAYLAKTGKPDDFFARDCELEEAHQAQHEILATMLKGAEVDLLTYFRKHEQERPLILSNDGFVVDGNRRLCAMRILYTEDHGRYSRFQHIDVVILPPCDERDLDELEAALQIQPDIKADYSWMTRAVMLRSRQEIHGYSDQDLARLYGLKPREIRELIDALQHAEAYLEERGHPRRYDLVEHAEYAFRRFRQTRTKLKTEGQRELFQQLAYTMIDDPGEAGRLYQVIPDIGAYLQPIAERLREELPPGDEYRGDQSDTSLLGSAAEEDEDFANLATRISDETGPLVREVIEDVIQTEKAKERRYKSSHAALNHVRAANSELQNALTCLDERSVVTGIQEQLIEIERSLAEIRGWLSGRTAN